MREEDLDQLVRSASSISDHEVSSILQSAPLEKACEDIMTNQEVTETKNGRIKYLLASAAAFAMLVAGGVAVSNLGGETTTEEEAAQSTAASESASGTAIDVELTYGDEYVVGLKASSVKIEDAASNAVVAPGSNYSIDLATQGAEYPLDNLSAEQVAVGSDDTSVSLGWLNKSAGEFRLELYLESNETHRWISGVRYRDVDGHTGNEAGEFSTFDVELLKTPLAEQMLSANFEVKLANVDSGEARYLTIEDLTLTNAVTG